MDIEVRCELKVDIWVPLVLKPREWVNSRKGAERRVEEGCINIYERG